jgi:hypothetical protein
MGKGSNVQKATQARERNLKKMGKSDEERKASLAQAKKDASAKMCAICRQTFMVNARPPLLYQHIVAKHPEIVASKAYSECYPTGELDGFDPADPKGEKAAAAAAAKANPAKKTSKKAGGGSDLDLLLDVDLKKGKKK